MNKSDLIYIAGHKGLVGSAITRELEKRGFSNLVSKTRSDLDLTNQEEVKQFFKDYKPEYVFMAAAKVGGILANSQKPAEFIYENLMIQSNILHQSYVSDVKKLLFLGSSCIYPKFANQPMSEDELLTGKLEPTNEAYAIAKIAGITMCNSYRRQYGVDFISAMPTNIYGPNDNFDLESSHVMAALLRKMHDAKIQEKPSMEVWSTGKPKREFLYVDDLADGLIFLMENYSEEGHVNIGTGEDISILELVDVLREIIGFEGEITFDTSKPDGTPRKLLDVTKIKKLGWEAKNSLREGITKTYQWFIENQNGVS
ncbi:MAG: GDP-L-fucose synthase [Candidatus Thorarchaeota archaeon]